MKKEITIALSFVAAFGIGTANAAFFGIAEIIMLMVIGLFVLVAVAVVVILVRYLIKKEPQQFTPPKKDNA
jgi:heme/copper-type cytochrome/quinol oxidase subunit 2